MIFEYPKIFSDVVEIVHRDGRGVFRDVGFLLYESRQARNRFNTISGSSFSSRVAFFLRCVAFERVRFAGASLIDEDDIAVALDGPERIVQLAREFGGALAGSAGEEEERVFGVFTLQRGKDDDFERNFATRFGLPVFPYFQTAAVPVAGAFPP